MREHLKRIAAKLPPPLVEILDVEDAAFRVCRWVAWGKWLPDRTLRLALALYLRREADLQHPGRSVGGWAWAEDRAAAAALRAFHATPQHARLVRVGALVPPQDTPSATALLHYTAAWSRWYEVVKDEVATLDRDRFLAAIKAETAPKRRIHRRRKRARPTPEQQGILDALALLRRGVLAGHLAFDLPLVDALTPTRKTPA